VGELPKHIKVIVKIIGVGGEGGRAIWTEVARLISNGSNKNY